MYTSQSKSEKLKFSQSKNENLAFSQYKIKVSLSKSEKLKFSQSKSEKLEFCFRILKTSFIVFPIYNLRLLPLLHNLFQLNFYTFIFICIPPLWIEFHLSFVQSLASRTNLRLLLVSSHWYYLFRFRVFVHWMFCFSHSECD